MDNNVMDTSNKRLIINMISNIISYSSSVLVSFVLTPYLINTLGKETYSFYPIANNIVCYMGILSNALNSMASRFITIEISRKNKENANIFFNSILYANILMSMIFLIPMLSIILFLDKFLQIPLNLVAAIKLLFTFIFTSMIINITTSVFGVATFAKNRMDLQSLRELILSILRILLLVIFFSAFPPSIIYIGMVAFIISLVNLIIQYIYKNILMPEVSINKLYFSFNKVKIILSSGVWNSVNQMGNILLISTTLLLANMIYGASEAGSYSIVQTVPSFINGVISMLTGVFIPAITYKYAKSDKDGLLKEIIKSQKLVGLFSCSIIAVFIGLSYEFFTLWVPTEDANRLQILSTFTILPHIIIGCVWPISNLNVVMNKVKVPALYMLISGVLNVVIICLVGLFYNVGILSIPIISCIIQVIWVFIFIPIYPCKDLGVSKIHFYPITLRAIFGSILCIFETLIIKRSIAINSWLSLFGVGIICGSLALLINGFLLFNTNEKKYIVKNTYEKIKKFLNHRKQ